MRSARRMALSPKRCMTMSLLSLGMCKGGLLPPLPFRFPAEGWPKPPAYELVACYLHE